MLSPWFAEDYPLLSVGSDCPALRSVSGKTLQVLGRRVVELDCDGHSMCVQFYVCDNVPFPLVSVSRFLIPDFWAVTSKDFMGLMTPNHQIVSTVRQGALVYLTPTAIPYDRYSGPRTELEICSLTQDIDLTSMDSELRGVSDAQDCQYDHLSKIADLIAASSGRSGFLEGS